MRTNLALLVVFALAPDCSSRRPAAETSTAAPESPVETAGGPSASTAPPTGGTIVPDAEPREVDRGLSLRLTLEDDSLAVGQELKLGLAFRNDSDAAATVVPPLDGSWDEMRQPLYSLEFLDDTGRPVPNALGFHEPGRCGMTNEFVPSDVVSVNAHADRALEEPLRWAAAFTVREHARPGTWKVRVRYRADRLEGVTPLFLVSNAVPLTLEGGDERLWACRNAQVEQARHHTYVNVSPSRLAPWGDGFVLVAHRAATRVDYPNATTTTSVVLLQRLGADLAPQGEPLELVRDDSGWLGLVEALPLADRLLVAWTVPVDEEHRRVVLAVVEESDGAFVPGSATPLGDDQGRPYYLGLAARADRVGVVWLGRVGEEDTLFFRLLDASGAPLAEAVELPASRGTASGRVLFAPSGDGWLLAWHQGGPDVRWQRLAADGSPIGDATRLTLDAGGLVALAETPGGLELVFDDNGVDNRIAGDTMGLHVAVLAPDGAAVARDVPLSPLDRENARFGAALRRGDRLARVFLEDKRLAYADGPDASAPRTTLSETAGGMFGLWPAADDTRVLAAWSDYRDDELARCLPVDCASEAYVAVVEPGGSLAAGPGRATTGAAPEPLVLQREDWQQFCAP